MDFTPKAERRGIQRAAIELGLNLLATNQEQHRPDDRFRIVDLPEPISFPQKEVPLCLPLAPEDRPLEQDPFEYTKKVEALRAEKDADYQVARDEYGALNPPRYPAPQNRKGPFAIPTLEEIKQDARDKLTELLVVYMGMANALRRAPRPLLEQLAMIVDQAIQDTGDNHRLYDTEGLTQDGLDCLEELLGESWNEHERDYEQDDFEDQGFGSCNSPEQRANLTEFEERIEQFMREDDEAGEGVQRRIPFWARDVVPNMPADPDAVERFTQTPYDTNLQSKVESSIQVDALRQLLATDRLREAGNVGTPAVWRRQHVQIYLAVMARAGRIQ